MSLADEKGTVLGLSWTSTVHDGPETVCRSGLLQLSASAAMHLSLDSGKIFSNNSETILNVFSVSGAMTDDGRQRTVQAVGSGDISSSPWLSFVQTIGVPGGAFDKSTSGYVCTTGGLYFASFTVGAKAHATSTIELVVVKRSGHTKTFTTGRDSVRRNGETTIAHEFLLDCPAGASIVVKMKREEFTDTAGGYRLNTFSVIPYLPKNVDSQAWSLLKDYVSYTQGAPMDPFFFNLVAYNKDGLWDENTRVVKIKIAGYYYVYVSSGTGEDKPLHLSVQRNGVKVMEITHEPRTQNNNESEGHGVIVALNANDILKVVGAMESYSYSTKEGLITSFFGMILYPM